MFTDTVWESSKDHGVLPENFPDACTFRTPQIVNEVVADVSSVNVLNTCGCPLRTEVPPIPKVKPVEKPENILNLLSKWILKQLQISYCFEGCSINTWEKDWYQFLLSLRVEKK